MKPSDRINEICNELLDGKEESQQYQSYIYGISIVKYLDEEWEKKKVNTYTGGYYPNPTNHIHDWKTIIPLGINTMPKMICLICGLHRYAGEPINQNNYIHNYIDNFNNEINHCNKCGSMKQL